MTFFLYDPNQTLGVAPRVTQNELIEAIKALPAEVDLFACVLRPEHPGLGHVVAALLEAREDRELPATSGGFIAQDGPWAAEHNSTPPAPSGLTHGAFQICSAWNSTSDDLGQLLTIPGNYGPLAGKSWLNREYWRWTSSAWPDDFFLQPGTLSTGTPTAWTGYAHGAFSALSGTITPSGGTLYQIRSIRKILGPPGVVVGYLWRKPSGDLLWFAKPSALDPDGYLTLPNGAFAFHKVTTPSENIDNWWRVDAPKQQ